MKRKNFLKISGLGTIGVSLIPHFSFINIQTKFSRNQLIGKDASLIIGDSYTSRMQDETKNAFDDMSRAAAAVNIKIEVVSAFRSFQRQKEIFEGKYRNYLKQGLKPLPAIEKIVEYSTIPGTSRHHWGTDVDLIQANVKRPENVLQAKHFHGTGAFCKLNEWLAENASNFGFYQVYTDNPKRKGFEYEPWHYSYAPLSMPMLKEYRNLNVKEILAEENILGYEYFSDEFLNKYKEENILDINPKLLS